MPEVFSDPTTKTDFEGAIRLQFYWSVVLPSIPNATITESLTASITWRLGAILWEVNTGQPPALLVHPNSPDPEVVW